jgi:transcriptional regulator with GAF, ATPase, and Fis domain
MGVRYRLLTEVCRAANAASEPAAMLRNVLERVQDEVVVDEIIRLNSEDAPLPDGIRSCVRCPIAALGRNMGVLVFGRRDPTPFSAEEVELLQDVAAAVAPAIAYHDIYSELNNLRERFQTESLLLKAEIDRSAMFEEIVGSGPGIRGVLEAIEKVAPTDSTVLITGETGTGKELIARAIHKRSRRSSRAMVTAHCAALPETLIASELFGHEKGAFTGAFERHIGRFEAANGGTIFLDEIGELSADTQVALLRVLQDGEFERVGGTQALRTDVRVIAATNRDLPAAIAEGRFRSDLYYRLNVFPIQIPPLRERREDIPLLVDYFVARYSARAGKRIRGIERKTASLFASYDWPGNVRELQNVIERAVILSEDGILRVDPAALGAHPAPARTPKPPVNPFREKERELIEEALAKSNGRVAGPSGAAAALGIPASTLESKIKRLKINKFRFYPQQ